MTTGAGNHFIHTIFFCDRFFIKLIQQKKVACCIVVSKKKREKSIAVNAFISTLKIQLKMKTKVERKIKLLQIDMIYISNLS